MLRLNLSKFLVPQVPRKASHARRTLHDVVLEDDQRRQRGHCEAEVQGSLDEMFSDTPSAAWIVCYGPPRRSVEVRGPIRQAIRTKRKRGGLSARRENWRPSSQKENENRLKRGMSEAEEFQYINEKLFEAPTSNRRRRQQEADLFSFISCTHECLESP